MKSLFFAFSFLIAAGHASADKYVKYTGRATVEGKLVYVEQHSLVFDDNNNLKSGETIYVDADNKPIAKLASDFLSSLTTPNHILENLISGNRQGIRREGTELILFNKNQNEDESVVNIGDGAGAKVLMGCQGLNYYLLENFDSMKNRIKLPIRFLIPSKLDYFDFNIIYRGESSEGLIDFDIEIDSWFLKIFTSKLQVRYDKKNKRIVQYKGLSNIPAKNGKLQDVLITYSYGS